MLLTKNVKIKISSSNIKFFNINNLKVGQEIEISIELLNKGSHLKVDVKCDMCGKERKIPYRQYLESLKNGNYYCCSPNCAKNKNKQTCLEKYGEENYINIEKMKKTCLKKYGVDSYLKTSEKQEKSKITCINKYGVEYYLQSDELKNNRKNVMKIKFGVENPSQSDIIKEKKKSTSFKNYGVSNPMHHNINKEKLKNKLIEKYGGVGLSSDLISNKQKITNLDKYGYENVFQNEEIKEKIKKSNLNKYGSDHYMKSCLYRQKYLENYIKKYGSLPEERKFQFKIYRNKISNLTNKNKKFLLENWDGCDFYDGEYIKDNFNFHYYDRRYPTIDHKISVDYGFNNNISPEEISRIENLCWTKRGLNSKKHKSCYEGEEKN